MAADHMYVCEPPANEVHRQGSDEINFKSRPVLASKRDLKGQDQAL